MKLLTIAVIGAVEVTLYCWAPCPGLLAQTDSAARLLPPRKRTGATRRLQGLADRVPRRALAGRDRRLWCWTRNANSGAMTQRSFAVIEPVGIHQNHWDYLATRPLTCGCNG